MTDTEKKAFNIRTDEFKICTDGEKCNSRSNFTECLVTDEDQSKASNNFDSLSSPKICKNYVDKCFVQVIKEDTVIRGCLDDYAVENKISSNFLDEVKNKRAYRVCSENLCNDDHVKPLHCITCNSTDPICTAKRHTIINDGSKYEKRCYPLEVIPSGCFHFDNGSFVERGCVSHLEEKQRAECEPDSDECKKCFWNGCNTKTGFLKCISNEAQVSKLCSAYEDQCFTLTKDDTVYRGCLNDIYINLKNGFDIRQEQRNRDNFEECGYDNCNNKQIESESCIVCKSEKGDDSEFCKYLWKNE